MPLLAASMEKLSAHPLSFAALLTADLLADLVDRDVPNHFPQLGRFVETSCVAMAAANTGNLPRVMSMH
ncbi:hypothetical protein EN829_020190 [Mesorhizobium sp. M00.F.Ca.ET.186.01.1.1]|nr:hypothetical protein EN848_29165 [bacterium M00.F.Ca.ET.205.01.1.1]TGU50352.1 hypothetical protein EN795_22235 [bacterium M00.F.Ca.ET.152.01.1.1]TGV33828.1 hypothetical protein EN829_020190 [Mesorhizobium sp. M00.F.Ca.ET.186.01.1.1]TGZ40716.1 hypothetical protein EN805_21630 [bacterium M00.F.Ca.ET.162.01.1.1]